MTASFRSNGTNPLLNDSLVIFVITGIRTDACCLTNDVGMGSRLQVAHADFLMMSRISPWSAGRNAEICQIYETAGQNIGSRGLEV